MKNIIALFAFAIITVTAQSQSLSQNEITGTWKVVSIENSSKNQTLAKEMTDAYLNFQRDKSFILKTKEDLSARAPYKTTSSENSQWSYNSNSQTIKLTKTKMSLKVVKNGDKVFFIDQDSGLKFEVIKPI